MKTFKELMEEMSGIGGPTNVTGANIAGTTPDTVGVRPEHMPKRKKLPKSPIMMKLKRNVPNDFK